ncbi:MAG: hypothetical protein MRY78_19025 [Saprospiraceae bacterium]|nr:hypothetical protein [Saprospiraceae bacterium]
MRQYFVVSLFCMLFSVTAIAQLPKSNIYMFDMTQVTDSTYQFSNPRYLTQFNANGYNNHPAFFSDSILYISSQLPSEAQPDIYELNLRNRTKLRVTYTAEGEFSPRLTPDEFNFSAVRQEYRGRDTLIRVWQFPVDRLSNGKPIFKYIDNSGYYEWLDGYRMALFMVEEPNVLAVADVRTDDVNEIATNVGRCFKVMPNGKLAYVQKSNFESWKIMEKNLYRPREKATMLIETLQGAEDFAVLPDGTLIMAKGSKLYKYNRYRDEVWEEIADFRYYEIRNISRIAVSEDYKIALVAN